MSRVGEILASLDSKKNERESCRTFDWISPGENNMAELHSPGVGVKRRKVANLPENSETDTHNSCPRRSGGTMEAQRNRNTRMIDERVKWTFVEPPNDVDPERELEREKVGEAGPVSMNRSEVVNVSDASNSELLDGSSDQPGFAESIPFSVFRKFDNHENCFSAMPGDGSTKIERIFNQYQVFSR
jgi:hypothetical protein